MYTAHFGFVEKPFKLKSDLRFLYNTPAYQQAHDGILAAISERRPLIALTGSAGSGKTTLLRRCVTDLEDSNAKVLSFTNTTLPLSGIIDQLAERLELDIEHKALAERIQDLQQTLVLEEEAGRSVVLIIDDAHNMDQAVLHDILSLGRLATNNRSLFVTVFSGLGELRDKLEPESDFVECSLAPLDEAEIANYIAHQIQRAGVDGKDLFTPNSLELIAEYTHGNPRTINSLCDAALFIGAMEGQNIITPEIIDRAAQQCFLKDPERVHYDYGDQPLPGLAGDGNEQIDPEPLQPMPVEGLTEDATRAALGLRFGDVSAELAAAGVASNSDGGLDDELESSFAPEIDANFGTEALDNLVDDPERTVAMPAASTRSMPTLGEIPVEPEPVDTPPWQPRREPLSNRPDFDLPEAEVELEHDLGIPLERVPEGRRWPGMVAKIAALVALLGGALWFMPEWFNLSRDQLQGYFDTLSGGSADAPVQQAPATTPEITIPAPAGDQPEPADEPVAANLSPPQPVASEPADQQASSGSDSAPGAEPAAAVADTGTDSPADTVAETPTVASESAAPETTETQAIDPDYIDTLLEGSTDESLATAPATPTDSDAATTSPSQPTAPEAGGATDAVVEDHFAKAQQISDLLERARKQISERLLTTPEDNNAYDSFQQVLALQPGNQVALDGLEQIKATYVSWAEAALTAEGPARAVSYYEKALNVDPADGNIRAKLEQLRRDNSQ